MDTTKKCNYCSELKLLSEFHRYPKGGKDSIEGHRECCDTCWNQRLELQSRGEKKCCKCLEIKEQNRFYGHTCITCYNRKRYAIEKDSMLARARKNNITEIGHKKRMLRTAKSRALSDNLPFNLTINDIIIPEFCPILGIKIQLDNTSPLGSSPSLDKLIPELGYVKGNAEVISYKANVIKSYGTAEEHEKIAQWIRQRIRRSRYEEEFEG